MNQLDHLTVYGLDQVHSACFRLPGELATYRARKQAIANTYDPDSDVVARSQAMAARAQLRDVATLQPSTMDEVRDAIARWWPSEYSYQELLRGCRKHPGALKPSQLSLCWKYVKAIKEEAKS